MQKPASVRLSVLTLALALLLTACASPSPTVTLSRFLTAYKSMDTAGMIKYLAISVDETGRFIDPFKFQNQSQEQMIKAVHKRFSYSIGDATIKDDVATVEVRVTSVDMAKILLDTINKSLTRVNEAISSGKAASPEVLDQVNTTLLAGINDPKAPTVTNKVTFIMVKVREEWRVVFDEPSAKSFTSALMGNLAQSLGK